jgi:hypothetical protein
VALFHSDVAFHSPTPTLHIEDTFHEELAFQLDEASHDEDAFHDDDATQLEEALKPAPFQLDDAFQDELAFQLVDEFHEELAFQLEEAFHEELAFQDEDAVSAALARLRALSAFALSPLIVQAAAALFHASTAAGPT